MAAVLGCGWSGVQERQAAGIGGHRFDVFVTADQNLQYQQNLSALPVSVLVLVSRDNRLQTLQVLVPQILASLATLKARSLVRIGD